MSKKKVPVKGEAIVIPGGDYKGKSGWLNAAEPYADGERIAIIVDLGGGMIQPVRVARTSIRLASMKPKNYAQGVTMEHHSILESIRAATNKLAACHLREDDIADASEIFARKLRMSVKQQAAKGSKARWIDVTFRREARRKRREAVVEEAKSKARAKKKAKVSDDDHHEDDVIRVNMLTGTLLLYRGPQRRAEFIYKK